MGSRSCGLSGQILAIRGAPGVGKSTLGELLRRDFPAGCTIDIDSVRRMVSADRFVFGEDYHYERVVDAVSAMLQSFLANGYRPAVVTDVFAAPFFRRFLAHFAPGLVTSVSLIAKEASLCARMSSRHEGYVNLAIACRVNRHIIETKAMSDFWIDTTDLTPDTVRRVILKALGKMESNRRYSGA